MSNTTKQLMQLIHDMGVINERMDAKNRRIEQLEAKVDALSSAMYSVLEGWTIPDGARKILEAAYYTQASLTATEKGCRILSESLRVSDSCIKAQIATITELRQGIRDHILWAEKVIDCDDLKELIGEDQ